MRINLPAAFAAQDARKPFPEQAALFRDTARMVCGFCAVRSGKSVGAAYKAAARILRDAALDAQAGRTWRPRKATPTDADEPLRLYWVAAPTYKLANLSWQKLVGILQKHAAGMIWQEKDGVLWLRNGYRIERRTAKIPTNLQGAEVSGCFADEICTWPYESWLELRNRLASVKGWLVAVGSPKPGSWPHREWWNKRNSGGPVSCHQWYASANPYLDRDEIEEARRTLPEAWFRRDWEASWDTFAGRVYSMVGEHTYISAEEIGRVEVVDLALDLGYHRPAALFVADRPYCWDVHGNKVHDRGHGDIVVEELVRYEVLERDWLRELAAMLEARGWWLRNVYVDPAGNQRSARTEWTSIDSIRAELPMRGSVLWPTSVEQTSITSGVKLVQGRIRSADGTVRLRISEHLRDEQYLAAQTVPGIVGSLGGYCYPDAASIGAGRAMVDEPVKDNVHDHFCLAEGEEVLTLRGWVPVEQVRVGDHAWSVALDGWDWRPVAAAAWSGLRQLVRVETERGTVTTTTDHKVMTALGWRPMGTVTAGCTLLHCCYANRPDDHQRDVPGVPRNPLLPVRPVPAAGRRAPAPGGVRGGAWTAAEGPEVARPPQERGQDGQPLVQPRAADGAGAPAGARQRPQGVPRGGARSGSRVAPLGRGAGVARGALARDLAAPRGVDGVLHRVRRGGRDEVPEADEVLRRHLPGSGDPAAPSSGRAGRPEAADQQWPQPPDGEALLHRLRDQLHGAAGEAQEVLLAEVLSASEAGFGNVYTLTVLGAGNYVTRGGFLHRNCDAARYLLVTKRPPVAYQPKPPPVEHEAMGDAGGYLDPGAGVEFSR